MFVSQDCSKYAFDSVAPVNLEGQQGDELGRSIA